MEGEYESRVLELQADLDHYKHKLTEQQSSLKQNELERSRLLQELIEQNHRLTSELKQVGETTEDYLDRLLIHLESWWYSKLDFAKRIVSMRLSDVWF